MLFFFWLCVLQENDSGTLDTVGAVVVDQEGNVAAAVSSGGLALKHPGRVGQVIFFFFCFFYQLGMIVHCHKRVRCQARAVTANFCSPFFPGKC